MYSKLFILTLIFGLLLALRSCAQEESLLQTASIEVKDETVTVSADLSFMIFDQAKYSFQVVDNPDRKNNIRLQSVVKKNNAVIGVNAGFFNVGPFTPQGLMIVDKKTTGSFPEKNWPEGFVGARDDGGLFIYSNDQHKDDPTIRYLVQGGPWLVKDSVLFKRAARNLRARRTFVGTDGKGKWIIGVCDSKVSLYKMAEILASPEMKKHIELTNVLNLDGGPSTGLAYNGPGKKVSIKEGWIVRNFLLVKQK